MPMNRDELAEVVARLHQERQAEFPRLANIRAHLRGTARDHLYIPKGAHLEYKLLVEMAEFNILPRLVSATAQNLYVDGYRPTSESGRISAENSPIWTDVWQPNRMDGRQAALYRAALSYGAAYATVLPGKIGDRDVPKITPWSPFRCTALYADPVNDEWPEYAATYETDTTWALTAANPLRGRAVDVTGTPAVPNPAATYRVRVWDSTHVYLIRTGPDGTIDGDPEISAHDLGVCPVVRYLDVNDLDGYSPGKVEPLIHIQHQIDQTTYGLLMTQQYQSFRQRWVSGMAIEVDENGNPIAPWNSAVDKVWHAESPDTKFGEFGEVSLAGYLESRTSQILFAATMAQIPPHHLVIGNAVSNISAEALVALETAHRQDIAEHQTGFGESTEQLLRLAGLALGTPEGREVWEDDAAQVVWRDTTPRSLAQVADALGKLASQLEIPARALWPRVPNTTDQDLEYWAALREEDNPIRELEAMLAAEKAAPPPAPGQEVQGGPVGDPDRQPPPQS